MEHESDQLRAVIELEEMKAMLLDLIEQRAVAQDTLEGTKIAIEEMKNDISSLRETIEGLDITTFVPTQ